MKAKIQPSGNAIVAADLCDIHIAEVDSATSISVVIHDDDKMVKIFVNGKPWGPVDVP